MRMELSIEIPVSDGETKEYRAQTWGIETDSPIICVHGYLDNSNSFAPIAPTLASAGYYVVALDLEGHGMTSNGRGVFYSWATDILLCADALGFKTFIYLGHSMGGAIGSVLVGSAPSRVSKLILLDITGPSAHATANDTARALRYSLAQRNKVVSRKPRVYESLDACVDRWSTNNKDNTSRKSVKLLLQRGTRRISSVDIKSGVGYVFRHDPRLVSVSPNKLREDAVKVVLGNITCPILLILATKQPYKVNAEFQAMRISYFKDITVERVEGGHHVHMDDPARVLHHLIPFLNKQSAKL